jgi:DNA-binding NarL/FixJ family response regulator
LDPHEIAGLSEALEKLIGRANALLLQDEQLCDAECEKNVKLARHLAQFLGALLPTIVSTTCIKKPVAPEAVLENQYCRENRAPGLTPRQRQILELLVKGMSNKEMARLLGLGEGTIKVHVGALFRSLGVGNRAAAAFVGARMLFANSDFQGLEVAFG